MAGFVPVASAGVEADAGPVDVGLLHHVGQDVVPAVAVNDEQASDSLVRERFRNVVDDRRECEPEQ